MFVLIKTFFQIMGFICIFQYSEKPQNLNDHVVAIFFFTRHKGMKMLTLIFVADDFFFAR